MHAITVEQFGGPEVLVLREVEDPRPGPGQVLVRLRAAGVNPVETYIRQGQYARLPALPYIPGSDGAGDVLEVGPGVTHLEVGDRVFVSGVPTYAEQTVAPATAVRRLPDHLSYAEGAALGVPYRTAYRALFTAGQARPGEWVLVHGASGGVGVAALQFGRAAGLLMVGTASTAAGRAVIEAQGAYALDHDRLPEAMGHTGGRGFDVIVEMAAHVGLGAVLSALAPRGRVVVVGSRAPVSINARDLMNREASIIGVMAATAGPDADVFDRALTAGLQAGSLKPVVWKRWPLAEAGQAHVAVIAGGAQGKIVLDID
jgi:NADPH2:quinone reductase